MNKILALLIPALVITVVCLASTVPAKATSGVFPSEPFNGMQITYSVSGAELDEPPTDSWGFTTVRTYQSGRLTGSVLRVSGRVTQSNGYGASLSVTVTAGAETKTYTAAGNTPWSHDFDVSVPIPAGATIGSFSISMTGNYNVGTRGLVVRGYMNNNAPTRTPTVTPTPTATPTPAIDISVKAAEYTQVIQCLDQSVGATNCADNAVPLVKDKTTIVRVYPQVQVVSGVFQGAAINANLVMDAPGSGSVASLNGPIQLKAAPDRGELNDSLNFRLPAAWTQYSTINLHIELNADHALPEVNYANNRRDMTLTFNQRQELSVLYVPVGIAVPGSVPVLPDEVSIRRAYYYVQKMFPLSDGGLRYLRGATKWYHKPLQTVPQQIAFVKWLAKLYTHADLLQATESYDQIVGFVAAGASGNVGWSDPLWLQPAGSGRAIFSWDGWIAGYSMAHELGHNLGLRHPSKVNNADACGAWDPQSNWPYNNATIQEVGLDPFKNGRGEVKLSTKKDVMSYCINYGAQSVAPIWISPFSYHRLYMADSQPTAGLAAGQTQQEVVIVSGMIASAGTATIDPLVRLSTTKQLTQPPAGTGYCLELQNGTGTVLSRTCFDVDFLDYNFNLVDQESFFFTLPFPTGTQRVVLKRGGTVLATRTASARAPAVTITAPTAGVTWNGPQTIRWTATDADGDALEFSLLYSKDGGASWLPIAAELTETSYAVDMGEFPGGTQARIRVLASDGFHTTSADAGPFTVSRKAPRPVIVEPEDGAVVFPGQPIVLVGGGDDLEDGALNRNTFSWSSNLVGSLGQGGRVDLAGLPRGDHRITLQARDSDGQTGTHTITIHVRPAYTYLPLTLKQISQPTWQTILADGFEGSFPGPWQRFGNPSWGRTNCRAGAGSYSVWPAAAGNGAVTPCVNVYPNNLNAWLVYGPFDLSGATAAEVTFRRWQKTEKDYDYFKWLASVDDQLYYGWQSSGNTDGWNSVTFDLSTVPTLGDLRGRSQVWIAFVMQSDGSNGDEGVFVDEVVVRKRIGAAAADMPDMPDVYSGSADLTPAYELRYQVDDLTEAPTP